MLLFSISLAYARVGYGQSWPPVSIQGRGASTFGPVWGTVVPLAKGHILNIYSGVSDQFYWSIIDRNGIERRNGILTLPFWNHEIAKADTLNQRIYIASTDLNYYTAQRYPIRSGVDYFTRIRCPLVCMDTSGRILWSKTLEPKIDSIQNLIQIEPDGSGGLYVAGQVTGSFSAALADTGNPQGARLSEGYYYIARLGPDGHQLWHRRIMDEVGTSLKANGEVMLRALPAGQVEAIASYTDTLYFSNPPAGAPLHKWRAVRFTSAGGIARQREAVLSIPGQLSLANIYQNNAPTGGTDKGYLKTVVSFTSGSGFSVNSNILELDSGFNLKHTTRLPLGHQSSQALRLADGRIAFTSWVNEPDSNFLWSCHFITLTSSRQIESWHRYANRCGGLANPWQQQLATLPSAGGGQDVLYLSRSGGTSSYDTYTNALFRFADGRTPPCRFITPQPAARQSVEDISAATSLSWTEGSSFTIRPQTSSALRDTVFNITSQPLPGGQPLYNLCSPIFQPATLPKDTILCDTAYTILPANYGSHFFRWNSFGKPISVFNDRSARVRVSGWYFLRQYDTCAIAPTFVDSIYVQFRQPGAALGINPDSISLCLGATTIAGPVAQPGYHYAWVPTTGVSSDTVSRPSFIADSLQPGYNQYILTATAPGACIASDTLTVYRSSGPAGQIVPSTPVDSVLSLVLANGNRHSAWQVNGGNILGSAVTDSLAVKWGPYFAGQGASVTIQDRAGCQAILNYQRSAPAVKPVPPEPYIPNIVTPNADGSNDFFEIVNAAQNSVYSVAIWSRWGKPVLRENYRAGSWPTADTGPGIYFYLIQAGSRVWKGWVEIVR